MTEVGAQGVPRKLLRLESLAVLVGAVTVYALSHDNWLVFAVLLLTPDLAMLGFMAGPRVGAFCYNTVHTYLGPVALLGYSFVRPEVQPYALIWLAHVAMDRALGYGLKYGTSFSETHLGRIGALRRPSGAKAPSTS
ncbi:DUF4260 family protein [Granulicella sp. 5B5]|uniref:DUF4260 domain-containing protein n=1 Tax=Granulicella sp. 5B5 TaxID=1617967 RepID=UPI0015F54FAD|nr:DUF4260 domain-containing protein [Granulicella sp. 5B5]QMV19587.1 DUF4260 family protein [Granulicella sp. 5B5]